MSRTISVKQGGKRSIRRTKTAILLLQCDVAAFDDGRRGEVLVQRVIEQQRWMGTRLARDLGATVRQEYIELGSGTQAADFAVLMEALTDPDLLAGRIDYVIAPDFTYALGGLSDLQEVYDAVYDAGAMLIPFRLSPPAAKDAQVRSLLDDLRAFFGDDAELSPAGTGRKLTARSQDASSEDEEACL